MKPVILLFILLSLVGCGNTYSPDSLEYALNKCANNLGVTAVRTVHSNGFLYVYCNDGARFSIKLADVEK